MVGRIDMWGDHLVGELPKPVEFKSQKVYEYVKDIKGIPYYVKNDGTVWKHVEGSYIQCDIAHGWVPRTGHNNSTEESFCVRQEYGRFFMPNPANMMFVVPIDGCASNTNPNNYKWSNFEYKRKLGAVSRYSKLRAIALGAEKNPRAYDHILRPKIEIPETITIRSQI